MPRRPRVNYALAATMLTSGMTMDEIASKVGAKNANVLKVGLHRLKITKRAAIEQPMSEAVNQSLALRVANQASELLRARFSDELAQTAAALGKVPVKANLKALRQRAEVLDTLVRPAKVVHAWDQEQKDRAVNLGVLVAVQVGVEAPTPQDAIDIESTPQQVVSAPPNPESA